MSETTSSSSSVSIGFVGILTIVFIVLKLCHVIAWPWIWVVSPIWISILLSIVFMVLLGLGFIIYVIVKRRRKA